MSSKPKVIVVLDGNGFVSVIADSAVEVFTYDPGLSDDRLYRLTEGRALEIDPATVAGIERGECVGHLHDGRDGLLLNPPPRRVLS